MSLIKVSIDCWGTLIKSTPAFSEAKIGLVKKLFPDISYAYIEQGFNTTKKELNNLIESTGCQPSDETIFGRLLWKLTCGYHDDDAIFKFRQAYQELANQHLPQIYSEETIEIIKKLSETHELIISSNTMFISGTVLERSLYENGIHDCFSKFLFSDRVKRSKPHCSMYGGSQFHIGDNRVTDFIGAKMAGSTPFIINSNDQTIKDAFDFILQNR